MFDEDDADLETPDETNASPELQRAFWTLVLLLDVAITAVAVGVLMFIFEVRPDIAPFVLGVGVLFLGSAYYRYRRARERLF